MHFYTNLARCFCCHSNIFFLASITLEKWLLIQTKWCKWVWSDYLVSSCNAFTIMTGLLANWNENVCWLFVFVICMLCEINNTRFGAFLKCLSKLFVYKKWTLQNFLCMFMAMKIYKIVSLRKKDKSLFTIFHHKINIQNYRCVETFTFSFHFY